MHCCCLVSHTRFVRRLLSSESSPQRIGGSAPTVADRTAAEEPLLLLDNRLEESDELQSWKAMQNAVLYLAAAAPCRNRVVHLVGGKRLACNSASGARGPVIEWPYATAARKLAKVSPGSGVRSSQVMAMGRSPRWLT